MAHSKARILIALITASFASAPALGQKVRDEGGIPQSAAPTPSPREVILATQRNHRLHVFDAATLDPMGYFAVNNDAESVTAAPDGHTFSLHRDLSLKVAVAHFLR